MHTKTILYVVQVGDCVISSPYFSLRTCCMCMELCEGCVKKVWMKRWENMRPISFDNCECQSLSFMCTVFEINEMQRFSESFLAERWLWQNLYLDKTNNIIWLRAGALGFLIKFEFWHWVFTLSILFSPYHWKSFSHRKNYSLNWYMGEDEGKAFIYIHHWSHQVLLKSFVSSYSKSNL